MREKRSILERVIEANSDYDTSKLFELEDEIEELIGKAEMWNTIRIGFSIDDLAENLEYIARYREL